MLDEAAALPLADLERIDDLCDRFEKRLRAGERPELSAVLAEAPSGREAEALVELLQVEAHFLGVAKADAYAERRLAEFPALSARARELLRAQRVKPAAANSSETASSANSPADGRLLDLLSEWNRRREAGDSVSAEELAPQDPELASRLRHAIQDVLRADEFLATGDETFGTRTNETDGGGGVDRETIRPDLTREDSPAISVSEALRRLRFAATESAIERGELLGREPGSTDGRALLRRLESEKLLTPFQLERLLGDRPESLSLGGYVLLDSLGEGGMGQVFLARHRAMNRVVALKLLPPRAVGSPESVSRFRREMQAAARLVHPHIVCAYDAGDSRGQYYLAMEYVEGQDLAARVKRSGPLTTLEALDLIDQAAAGLEFAHARGMVHRDIKPSNLLVDANGTLKIVDFGLARLSDAGDANGAADLTSTNAMMGTVDFMPPEQAADARTADHRADIYSLGCTLYYLIAGRAPFGGESVVARVLAHRDAAVPSLRSVDPSVPPSLEETFRRMLAKRPEDRVQSVAEARNRLRAGREELLAREHAKITGASRDGGRGRKGLLLGAAAAGFLLALVALTVFLIRTPNGTIVVEVNEPGAEIEVLDGDRVEIRRMSDGQRITLSVDPGRKRLKVTKDGFDLFVEEFELGSGDKRQLVARLEPLEAAPAPPMAATSARRAAKVEASPRSPATALPEAVASHDSTPRDSAPAVTSLIDWSPGPSDEVIPGLIPRPAKLPGVKRWQAHVAGQGLSAAWHPDGKRIAYSHKNGVVTIVEIATGKRLRTFVASEKADLWHIAWNKSGDLLAAQSNQSVKIWTAEGELYGEIAGHTAYVSHFAWSSDGSRLASSGHHGDPTVRIWSADGTAGPVIQHTEYGGVVAWSPDDKTLASIDEGTRTIVLSDPDDGRELGRLGPLPDHCQRLAWSPDGKFLASCGGDWSGANVGGYIWDVAQQKQVVALKKANTWLNWLGWSADGKLAATSQDDYVLSYDPESGEILAQTSMLRPQPWLASWSPDGKRLADASGRIWRVGDDGRSIEQEEPAGHDRTVSSIEYASVSWSPDGGQFVASGSDGNFDLWTDDGEFVRSLAHPRDVRRFVDWHPTEPRFLTGGRDNHAVEIWNANGTLELSLLGHAEGVRCQKWSPDGKRIASGDIGGTVRIWDANGTPGAVLEGHEDQVCWVAWSPDGSQIASAGGDGTVRLWSADGEAKASIVAHEGTAHCVEWSPDGSKLASVGYEDGRVRLWDAKTHERLADIQAHGRTVDVRWSPEGERLATLGAEDGVLRIWDASLQPLGAHFAQHEACGIDWTSSGDRLALVSHSNFVRLYDRHGEPERILVLSREQEPLTILAGGERLPTGADALSKVAYLIEDEAGDRTSLSAQEFDAFVASGKAFDDWRAMNRASKSAIDWTLGPADDVLPGLIPRPAKLPGVKRWQVRVGDRERVVAAWHPDGSKIAYGDRSGAITIVDAETERPLITFIAHEGEVADLEWNRDGSLLASSGDVTPKIWDQTGDLRAELVGHQGKVSDVSWSSVADVLASAGGYGDGTVRLWTADGTPGVVIRHRDRALNVAWSPDGKTLASVDEGSRTIVLSDPVDGKELGRLGPLPENATCHAIAWSPTGDRIACGGGDVRNAKIGGYVWSVAEGRVVAELPVENAAFMWLGWSSQGVIATTSPDAILRLYDPETGELLAQTQLDSWSWRASWSPDGTRIVDARGRMWPLDAAGTTFGDRLDKTLGWAPSSTRYSLQRFDCVAWSPQGDRFAATGYEGLVFVWNADGTLERTLAGHAGKQIRCVAWSPDGKRLATGGWDDKTVRLWNLEDDSSLELKGHASEVCWIAFAPGSDRLASASSDGTARLWNVDGTEGAQLTGHQDRVVWVDWNPDGTRLATASADGTARIWDVDGTLERTLEGHEGGLHSVDWHPDGRRLASVGFHDADIRLWNLEDGSSVAIDAHDGPILQVAWRPDGKSLATLGWEDRTIRLWNDRGERIATLPIPYHTSAMDWTADGERLAAAAFDGTIRFWNATGESEGLLVHFGQGSSALFGASGEWLNGDRKLLDESLVYFVETESGETLELSPSEFEERLDRSFDAEWSPIRQTSWEPGPEASTLGPIPRPAVLPGVKRWQVQVGRPRPTRTAWSPDERILAYAEETGEIRFVDSGTQELIATAAGHESAIQGLAWSPDGAWLASCGDDKTVRLWDANGKPGRVFSGHTAMVCGVAWSPDGQRLVSSGHWGDSSVRVWNLDGSPGPVVQAETYAQSVQWSPDGSAIAFSDVEKKVIKVLRPDGSVVTELGPTPRVIYALAWSGDSTRLASSGGDWSKNEGGYVWSVADGKPIATLEKPNTWINTLRWSSDGKLAATAQDEYVELYDAETGRNLSRTFVRRCWDLAWSPDGTRLADNNGNVWSADESPGVLGLEIGALYRPEHSRIKGAAWSPDGERFAAIGDGATVFIMSVDGSIERTLSGHRGSAVFGVAWNPDGNRLVTGGWDDQTLRLWNLADGGSIELAGHSGPVDWVAFRPDGGMVASASNDGTARLWNVDGTPGPSLIGHDGRVIWVDWSPDGARLATAGEDGSIRIWTAEGTLEKTLRGHEEDAHCVDWHPDGKRLASVGWSDSQLRLWNLEDESSRVVDAHTGPIYQVAWNPDGETLATLGHEDRTVRIWNSLGEAVGALPVPAKARSVDWSADGDELAVSAYDGTIRWWNAAGEFQRLLIHWGGRRAFAFSEGGERFGNEPAASLTELNYLAELPSGEMVELSAPEFDDFVGSRMPFDAWREERRAPPDRSPTVATGRDFSLQFDGVQSHVALPFGHGTARPITVEAEILIHPEHASRHVTILGNNDSSGLVLSISHGKVIWQAREAASANGTRPAQYVTAECKTLPEAGTRVVIAGVFDGSRLRLFVNGKLEDEQEVAKYVPSPRGFYLGASAAGDGIDYPFAGEILRVRISNDARYLEDYAVSDEWTADGETLALYSFYEGEGNLLHDVSDRKRHGTILGASWRRSQGEE